MIYNLVITAEFENIKALYVEQCFFVTIRCTSCSSEHPKPVVISADSLVHEKFEYKCNFEAKCQTCMKQMRISVGDPKSAVRMVIDDKGHQTVSDKGHQTVSDKGHQTVSDKELLVNNITPEGCVVSTFSSNTAEIVDVKDFSINLITESGQICEGLEIDSKRCLAGSYGRGNVFGMTDIKKSILRKK